MNVGAIVKGLVLVVTVLLAGSFLAAGPASGPTLPELEEAMESARTQAEMNRSSYALAEYWDQTLAEEVERVLAVLPDREGRELFETAQEAWLAWREAEVLVWGDGVRGGTARPTVESLNWVTMTKERIEELRQLRALYGDGEPPDREAE